MTSVGILVGSMPGRFQYAAVSISYRSRATIQSSFSMAARWKPALTPPAAGFWPIEKYPFIFPSFIVTNMARSEWSSMTLGR